MSESKKLRLLVSRFNSSMHVDAIRVLKDRGYEIVYWERSRGTPTKFDQTEFPDTILHSGLDARMGIPAPGVDVSSFEPLSKEFIHAMHECESQVLTMMNVEDLRERVSLIKRKHIYYKYLKYWRGVLVSLKIDAIISGDIPHVSFQYVLYCVAQELGVPFIMCRMAKVGSRYVVIDDFRDYKALREEAHGLRGGAHEVRELDENIRAYYNKHAIKNSGDATPYYVKDFMRKGDFRRHDVPSLKGVWKSLKQLSFFRLVYSHCKDIVHYYFTIHRFGDIEGMYERGYVFSWYDYRWDKIKKRYQKKYQELEKEPDFTKKYIYFALHNQPECSTSAMGGLFVNQFLAIDMLSAALPKGWELYIKENPGQWIMPRTHTGRFPGFYEDIANLKNVQLVPQKTSTFELIKNSQAVASITSAACLEGVLRGKPALLFGYVWFMHCEGVLRVQNFSECREAVEKIKNGLKPNSQEVLNYFIALDKVSFTSFHNTRAKTGFGLNMSEEENSRGLADNFEKELGKYI